MSQDYRDGFMSVLFLECKGLHDEFPEFPPCCDHCHSEENKATHRIYVRPIGPDGLNADWYLCVEAIVCCALYHHVRAIPYEWWEGKSIEYKVKRDDMRGYIYPSSPEKDTDRVEKKTPASIQGYKKEKAKREIARQRDSEEAGGLGAWLKR